MSEQHGRARRDQLLAAGVTRGEIDGRRERGVLIDVHQGVYAAGHTAPSVLGDWMAATLAGGHGAALSHLHAASLHRLVATLPPRVIDITVPGGRHQRPGLRFHRTRMQPDEIMEVKGIPATGLARTLRDCAALLDRDRLNHAIDEAQSGLRFDPLTVSAVIGRYPRHPGAVILRRTLEDRTAGRTRSWLERRFKRITKGLPEPRRNHRLQLRDRVIEADCFWAPRYIVELDGRTYHERQLAFESDRARDWAAAIAGYQTLRLTWMRIRDEPGQIRADLAELLAA